MGMGQPRALIRAEALLGNGCIWAGEVKVCDGTYQAGSPGCDIVTNVPSTSISDSQRSLEEGLHNRPSGLDAAGAAQMLGFDSAAEAYNHREERLPGC